ALASGFVTLFIWLFLGFPFDTSLERMVTVMVITCPHALGLAAPLVTAVSTSLSAKQGLLIRNRTNFEQARKVNAVIFDKTGTLTKGEFGVENIQSVEGTTENDVLQLAASVEQHSEHPLAQGIVKAAEEREIRLSNVTNFASITGQGISGMIGEKNIRIVSPGYMNKNQLHYDEEYFNRVAEEGKTVVFVLQEETLKGMIALADLVRETAKEAIQELHEQDIHIVMLTGDNERVANWVAKQLAIDEVYAEILPEEKANKVKEIQQRGFKTAMTGDGINDAPALATA